MRRSRSQMMPQEEPGLAFHCCVVFIGFCCLTSSTISLTMAALYMSGERPTYKEPGGERENNEEEAHLIVSAVIDIIGVACDAGLLVAVAKQIPTLVLAWVVVAPMRGVGQVVIAIMVCVKYHTRSSMVYVDAVFTGIFLMCLVFFANVCFNYYRVMRTKKRRQARAEARWRAARAGLGQPTSRNGMELASSGSWISTIPAAGSSSTGDQPPERLDRSQPPSGRQEGMGAA